MRTRNLLWRSSAEMIDLTLVWRATAMPEEHPLQALVSFKLILEAELIVLVCELEQVKDLSGGFVGWEGRRLVVVNLKDPISLCRSKAGWMERVSATEVHHSSNTESHEAPV